MPLHLITINRLVVTVEPNNFKQGRVLLECVCDAQSYFEELVKKWAAEKRVLVYDGPPVSYILPIPPQENNAKQPSSDHRVIKEPSMPSGLIMINTEHSEGRSQELYGYGEDPQNKNIGSHGGY